MLKFDWNGLLPGDRVLVHTSLQDDLALAPGVVTSVQQRHAVNGVGIRVGTGILWPVFPAVHLDPYDPAETCWRCEGARSASSARS